MQILDSRLFIWQLQSLQVTTAQLLLVVLASTYRFQVPITAQLELEDECLCQGLLVVPVSNSKRQQQHPNTGIILTNWLRMYWNLKGTTLK